MPSWNEILAEVKAEGSVHDVVRRKYLKLLNEHTKRNVIIYYSGWLQKGELQRQGYTGFSLDDGDKNGFMTTIHNLDRSKGLDLILHTPGGGMAATESLVDYLRSMFDIDIRAIIPQLAMSAGTMVALSCKQIVMGDHSSLGPIDPQIGGRPAHGIIEEFARARTEIAGDRSAAYIWQPIIAQYSPTLIGECQKAIIWSTTKVREWLKTGMFKDDGDRDAKANKIVDELGSHSLTLSHERHISKQDALGLDLKVSALEDDPTLQDLVLSVHHASILTLTNTEAIKIIENHDGVAFIHVAPTRILAR